MKIKWMKSRDGFCQSVGYRFEVYPLHHGETRIQEYGLFDNKTGRRYTSKRQDGVKSLAQRLLNGDKS